MIGVVSKADVPSIPVLKLSKKSDNPPVSTEGSGPGVGPGVGPGAGPGSTSGISISGVSTSGVSTSSSSVSTLVASGYLSLKASNFSGLTLYVVPSNS